MMERRETCSHCRCYNCQCSRPGAQFFLDTNPSSEELVNAVKAAQTHLQLLTDELCRRATPEPWFPGRDAAFRIACKAPQRRI